MAPIPGNAEHLVCSAIADYWVAEVEPNIISNSCISAARLAHEVLRYFAIPHRTEVVSVIAFNDLAYEQYGEGIPTSAWPDEAWSVACLTPDYNTGSLPKPTTGFDGHMVLLTQHYCLDLTVSQFDRPSKNILTGGPLITPYHELRIAKGWRHQPLRAGHMIWREDHNPTYRSSPAWRHSSRAYIGECIRHIRALLAESA